MAVFLAGFVLATGPEWKGSLPAQFDGKSHSLEFMRWGLWWASVVNIPLCMMLALTARWWAASKPEQPRLVATYVSSSRLTRGDWLMLAVILVTAGAVRWARMDLSLYNDEAHAFRRYIAGQMTTGKTGEIKWRQVKWVDTYCLNTVGNNSPPFSLLSRLCYTVWQKVTGASNGVVCEAAIRFPSLLAGMASLVVLWLALRRMSSGAVSWWGLIFCGLHPWHVRYSSEARGYGLLMFGVSLCFYFLIRAMEERRWRWWLGLGASQALCVCSFPGAVYFLLIFNALLLGGLAWKAWRGASTAWVLFWRALIGVVLGGMATGEFMLPSAVQLAGVVGDLASLKGHMGLEWWKNALCGCIFGIRWADEDPGNPFNLAFVRQLTGHPALWLALAGAALLWVHGTIRLCRKSFVGLIVALSGPLGMVLGWGVMARQDKWLHYWYLIFLLPSLACVCAEALAQIRWRAWTAGTGLLATVAMGVWIWADCGYCKMGKENMKELIPLTRGAAYPEYTKTSGHPLLAGVFTDIDVYDPLIRIIRNEGELEDMIAQATVTKRKLYVTHGLPDMMKELQKGLLTRLNNAKEFTPVMVSRGIESPQFTHYVFLWNGAPSAVTGKLAIAARH